MSETEETEEVAVMPAPEDILPENDPHGVKHMKNMYDAVKKECTKWELEAHKERANRLQTVIERNDWKRWLEESNIAHQATQSKLEDAELLLEQLRTVASRTPEVQQAGGERASGRAQMSETEKKYEEDLDTYNYLMHRLELLVPKIPRTSTVNVFQTESHIRPAPTHMQKISVVSDAAIARQSTEVEVTITFLIDHGDEAVNAHV